MLFRHVATTTSCRTYVLPQLVRPFRMVGIKSVVPCRDFLQHVGLRPEFISCTVGSPEYKAIPPTLDSRDASYREKPGVVF